MAEPTYRLPCYRRFAYGIGHVLNDLCASIWFSYLLVYYHSVLQFSNANAGFLMLLGQVADAIATPLVGYESDRIQGFCRYTKRKSWHLLGTMCVIASFPFLFMPTFGDQHAADWARFIYYAPFVVIFQFGWASTQISHLSLIPELTPNSSERVELNAIRYAFTVCSNVAVYVTAWLLLNSADANGANIGRSDVGTFRTLVISVVSAGAIFSLIFHIFTQEKREEDLPRGLLSRLSSSEKMNWMDWLKEPQFYMIAMLYMCTRLIVNVSQIYLPMYLTDSLELSKQYIATVPLAVFFSGFLISFIMRPLNLLVGRKLTYLLGILVVLGAVTWMFFLHNATNKEVFGAAILLGAGSSTILVTSLSMTADLIEDRTESGAFVYGAMSFTDKLSNGIAVVVIQHLHPCKTEACCSACVWFYRDMIVFVPGGVAILALICLIIIAPQNLGTLRKSVGNQFRRGLIRAAFYVDSGHGEGDSIKLTNYGLYMMKVVVHRKTEVISHPPLSISENMRSDALSMVGVPYYPSITMASLVTPKNFIRGSIYNGRVQHFKDVRHSEFQGSQNPVRDVYIDDGTGCVFVSLWKKTALLPIERHQSITIKDVICKNCDYYDGDKVVNVNYLDQIKLGPVMLSALPGALISVQVSEYDGEVLITVGDYEKTTPVDVRFDDLKASMQFGERTLTQINDMLPVGIRVQLQEDGEVEIKKYRLPKFLTQKYKRN